MLRRERQQGFSLTEMAIVLGIIGVVIGGIWAAASMVRYNRLVQQEKADLLYIVSSMRNLYAGKSFSGLDQANFFNWQQWDFTGKMVKYDVYPKDLPLDTTTVVGADPPLRGTPYNREGGRLKLWPFSNSPAADPNRVFEVEYYNTPKTCQRLAYETSKMAGDLAPIYIYTDVSNWILPADSSWSSFAGCTFVSWTFDLK